MLTKEQLQKLADRHHIGKSAQERDYIQSVFLYLLYRETQDFYFKGGTCLKVVYGSPRYSEDLDFNCNLERDKVKSYLLDTVLRLKTFGIEAETRKVKFLESGFTFDLSFKGMLFNGRAMTKNKIRIDVSLRREKVKLIKKIIDLKYEYPDIPPFSITSLSLDYIFAGKFRALATRGKPRDLWDIWYLFKTGKKPDITLVNERLKLYNEKFSTEKIKENLERITEEAWTNDLKALLPQFVELDEAKKEILQNLANEK